MSEAVKITCDGCGFSTNVSLVRGRRVLPLGWIRLRTSSRTLDDETRVTLGPTLDICTPACATPALTPPT